MSTSASHSNPGGTAGGTGADSGSAGAGGPQWLSTAQASDRLGVTPRTLYRFIDEGQLPGYRFGRVIRLKADEIDGFIESCRIEPGTLEHLYPEAVPRDA